MSLYRHSIKGPGQKWVACYFFFLKKKSNDFVRRDRIAGALQKHHQSKEWIENINSYAADLFLNRLCGYNYAHLKMGSDTKCLLLGEGVDVCVCI